MRCHIHCPPGHGGEVVAATTGIAAAAAGLVITVVAVAGTQLVAAFAVLCVIGVVALVMVLRRGPVTWRPARQPSRRVLKALAGPEEHPAVAPVPARAIKNPVRPPVYAVITDLDEIRGRR